MAGDFIDLFANTRPKTPFTPGQPLPPEWLKFFRDGIAYQNQDPGGNQNYYGSLDQPYYDYATQYLAVADPSNPNSGFRLIPNANAYLGDRSLKGQAFNGKTAYQYDNSGNFLRTSTEQNWGESHLNPLVGALGIMALPFAASAAGLGAGAAGSAATTAPVLGSTGAIPGTALGGAGAGAAGAIDLGGGLMMTADGAIVGGSGAFAGATAAEMAGMGVGAGSGILSGLGGWGSLIGPAATLIGGAMQYSAAGDAADAMRDSANKARELLQPYVSAGNTSLGAYQDLSGANGPDKQRAAMAALEASPQFASLSRAGENAILQNASATGGLRGGNVQGALADRRTQLLNGLQQQQLGNYLPVANMGQNAAAGSGTLLTQAGAAQAGGIVAGSNAITNAIGGLGGYFAGQAAGQVPSVVPGATSSYSTLPTNGIVPGFGSGIVQGYSNGGNLF